jgi:hypothetical protein
MKVTRMSLKMAYRDTRLLVLSTVCRCLASLYLKCLTSLRSFWTFSPRSETSPMSSSKWSSVILSWSNVRPTKMSRRTTRASLLCVTDLRARVRQKVWRPATRFLKASSASFCSSFEKMTLESGSRACSKYTMMGSVAHRRARGAGWALWALGGLCAITPMQHTCSWCALLDSFMVGMGGNGVLLMLRTRQCNRPGAFTSGEWVFELCCP